MKYILVIFIFVSFLFSQMLTVSNDKSIERVEEIVKDAPRTDTGPKNISNQRNFQIFENEVNNYNAQDKPREEFDENAPRTDTDPKNISIQRNLQIFENEVNNYTSQDKLREEFDENAPRR